jgi:nucleoside-diphosphate-sugar epimerase
MSQLALVTGAGGFIGGQLIRDLLAKGVAVRAVDKKAVDDWYVHDRKSIAIPLARCGPQN